MSLTGEISELNLINSFSKMKINSLSKNTENNEPDILNEETFLTPELEGFESANINEIKIVNDLEDNDHTENSKYNLFDFKSNYYLGSVDNPMNLFTENTNENNDTIDRKISQMNNDFNHSIKHKNQNFKDPNLFLFRTQVLFIY